MLAFENSRNDNGRSYDSSAFRRLIPNSVGEDFSSKVQKLWHGLIVQVTSALQSLQCFQFHGAVLIDNLVTSPRLIYMWSPQMASRHSSFTT